MIQKKIIWITGSSGFLGNRLVQHFKSEGHNVVGISRRGCQADHSVVLDLGSDDAVKQLRESPDPDVVIHAASKQPGPGSLAEFVTSNVRTTQKLIDALARSISGKDHLYVDTVRLSSTCISSGKRDFSRGRYFALLGHQALGRATLRGFGLHFERHRSAIAESLRRGTG